ncbi:S8 family serine peptidase [Cohnella soli]|uniref:S8 family serine peptidase n=1 Tax=Cohnella soli TaxID=425005 RepID=A0ABW0HPS1_9BACL
MANAQSSTSDNSNLKKPKIDGSSAPSPQNVIIKFKDVERGKKQLKDKRKKVKKAFKHARTVVVEQLTSEEIASLRQDPNVEYAEIDSPIQLAADRIIPDIEQIHAASSSVQGVDGTGIKVAVLDTGINTESAELSIAGGVSFVPEEPSFDDLNGHGTAVAGILAAQKNETGIVGVAPGIDLYAVKVMNQSGVGYYSQVIDALDWAIEQHIDIVSMSFAGQANSKALSEAIHLAAESGILMVAATGNDGINAVSYPAKYDKVVAVGAVNRQNQLAYFSNTGNEVDLVAPGVDVEVLKLDDTTEARSGTSFAVPFVTGTLALLKSQHPEMGADAVRQQIINYATPLSTQPSPSFGHGLVNAEEALRDHTTGGPTDPTFLFALLQQNVPFSALQPEERQQLADFYGVQEALFEACEQANLSLSASLQAIPRMKQFDLSPAEFIQLSTQQPDLKQLDKVLLAYQALLRHHVIREEAREAVRKLLLDGYNAVSVYNAYVVGGALNIPMEHLAILETAMDDDRFSQLESIADVSEAKAAQRLISMFIVNPVVLQNYVNHSSQTWTEVEAQLQASAATQEQRGGAEPDPVIGIADGGAPTVSYDKYVQAPFDIKLNGNESVEAGTGNLIYSMKNYSLSGRSGLDVQLNLRYDGAEAGLYEPDYYYSYSRYDDYDYIVTGGALAGYSNWIGTGRVPALDIAESVRGTYETFEEAVVAALNWQANSYTHKAYWSDGTDLTMSYYANITPFYDPSGSWESESKSDLVINNTYTELQSNLGSGWSLDFPSIESDSRGTKYLHLPGGRKYKVTLTSTVGDSNLDQYTLKDLRLETDSSTYTNTQSIPSAYVLLMEGGGKDYFGSDGRLLAMQDRFGNTIKFEHTVINGRPVISKITDTLDRNFLFAYTTDAVGKKLIVTLPDSNKIQYISKLIPGYTNEYMLDSVIDQQGRTTSFQYDMAGCNTSFSFFSKSNRSQANPVACLKTITYPTNATTTFTYQQAVGNLGNQGSYSYNRVLTREDKADGQSYGKVTYGYTGNFTGYPDYSSIDAMPTGYQYVMTAMDTNNTVTLMKFNNKHLLESSEVKQGSNNISRVVYVYNADRLPTSISTTQYNIGTTESATKTESYQYDAWGGVLSYTNPLGDVTTYTYENTDLHRQLTASSYMDATTIQQTQFIPVSPTVEQVRIRHFENGTDYSIVKTYTYDSYHNLISEQTPMRDGSTVTINYEYSNSSTNKSGYLTRAFQTVKNVSGTPELLEQSYTYDFTTGALLTYKDANQHTTSYSYDKLGRLLTVTMPANPTTSLKQLIYDDANNTVEQVNEEGYRLRNLYDRLGRLVKTQSYKNSNWVTLTENHYNALGWLDWTKDAAGNQTTYQYDALGRNIKIINPGNPGSQTFKQIIYKDAWLYENGSNQVQTIDEDNRSTWEYYNKIGWKTADKVLDFQRYTYDKAGNLKTFVDAKGKTTQYVYDDLNRLTQVTNAMPETTSYAYDNLNRLIRTQFPNGDDRQQQYDEAGRIIKKTDEGGDEEKFFYDKGSNMTKHVYLKGQTYDFSYDARDWLKSVVSTSGGTTQTKSFTYNKAGQRLTATNEAGTFSYQYRTDNGELKRMTYPDGRYTEIETDWALSQSQLTDPYGQQIFYKYDERKQLDYVSLNSIIGTREVDYSYTNNGKLSAIAFPNGISQTFEYYANDGNQLYKVKHKNASNTVLNEYTNTYDPNFNIKQQVNNDSTITLTYDPLNRIKTSTDGNEIYDYDTQGNRLSLQSDKPLLSSGDKLYVYDLWDQLTSATVDGVTTTYMYDPDGLLYERSSKGSKTRYYYFKSQLIAKGNVASNGSASLTARYIYGNSLAMQMDDEGNKLYYLTNAHGDVVELRKSDGGFENHYSYDLWGNVTGVANSNETVDNQFMYAGEFWDDATGLQYLRARWYDPSIGRFINKDTYEGQVDNPLTLNLYTYVQNNPLIHSDPSGHLTFKAAWYIARGSQDFFVNSLVDGVKAVFNFNTYKNIWNVSSALINGDYDFWEFASVLGDGVAEPFRYIKENGDHVLNGKPTKSEAYAFGQAYGKAFMTLQAAFTAGVTLTPKLAAAFSKATSLLKMFKSLTANVADLRKNPLDEFDYYGGNYNADALRKAREYIHKNGTIESPIKVRILDDGTMEIVDGHHRWWAAQQAGLKTVPIEVVK